MDALQQQIKQYVTACSGVEVKDIRVQIESSGPETKDSLFVIEAPTARALPGGTNQKDEKTKEKPENEPAQMTQEEVEKVMAEMPAPPASDAEDDVPKVEISAAAVAAAEMLKNEAPQEEDDRPIHQRLFSSPEEPCVMPMPPAPEQTEEAAGSDEPEEKDETEEEKPAEEEKPTETETKEEVQEGTDEGSKDQ